jgi:hypothetical protein
LATVRNLKTLGYYLKIKGIPAVNDRYGFQDGGQIGEEKQ